MIQPVLEVNDGLFNAASRQLISLHDPDPESILIEDIANGLSNICRFGGQLQQFYSVAQHSCLVACIAPEELKREALLHDASEAYLGDVIKPLKVLLGTAYSEIEDRFMEVIFRKFGADITKLPLIKEFDIHLLEVEHEFFFGNDILKLYRLTDKYFKHSTLWSHHTAKTEFLNQFRRYFNQ